MGLFTRCCSLCRGCVYYFPPRFRRSGEIGRRSGLKIRRGRPRGGSTPPSGTFNIRRIVRLEMGKLLCLARRQFPRNILLFHQELYCFQHFAFLFFGQSLLFPGSFLG